MTVDGRPRGQAPLSLELNGGKHSVVIEKRGFTTYQDEVGVPLQGSHTLHAEPSSPAVGPQCPPPPTSAEVGGLPAYSSSTIPRRSWTLASQGWPSIHHARGVAPPTYTRPERVP